ncbi:hypothetical protein E3J38_02990 [candidate division TA06 bacterium]|uniref:Uncharacterized protein n=1 Tax=candidate division TA06 bacterium TaxID=2250710 RepID=A0A523XRN6_UNCT6|nr:MAG: hypothetical protein E3J38_02990 [candidate division TA06 bacterium]
MSVRVFQELISSAGGIGKTSEQVARQTADALISIPQEDDSKIKETEEASKDKAESLTRAFGEALNVAGANAKGEKEAREVERRMETRLRYLAKMYASNKDKQAEEEDEEEEG